MKSFKFFGLEIVRRHNVAIPPSHVILALTYGAGMLVFYVALFNADGCAPDDGLEAMLARFCGWGKLAFMVMATVGLGVLSYVIKNDIYRIDSGD